MGIFKPKNADAPPPAPSAISHAVDCVAMRAEPGNAEAKPIDVAALVATRDRPRDLARLLASLAEADRPEALNYRVVVVDNSKLRSAAPVVAEANLPMPIAYLHEPRPGLSRARNAGLRTIDRGYLATLDDDIIVPKDYLTQLHRVITEHPAAGVIGGRVELYNPDDYPISIRTGESVERYQGGTNIFGFIPGCNQIIRRDVIDQVGFYDTRLGAGTPTGAAEDDDMVYRIWKKGHQAVYVPSLLIYHNHGRTARDAKTLQRNYIRGNGAFVIKHLMRFDANAMRMFMTLVPWCLKAAILRRGNLEFAQTYLKHFALGALRFFWG